MNLFKCTHQIILHDFSKFGRNGWHPHNAVPRGIIAWCVIKCLWYHYAQASQVATGWMSWLSQLCALVMHTKSLAQRNTALSKQQMSRLLSQSVCRDKYDPSCMLIGMSLINSFTHIQENWKFVIICVQNQWGVVHPWMVQLPICEGE